MMIIKQISIFLWMTVGFFSGYTQNEVIHLWEEQASGADYPN